MVVLEFLFFHFCDFVTTVQEPFECWLTVLELANQFKNWFSSRINALTDLIVLEPELKNSFGSRTTVQEQLFNQ